MADSLRGDYKQSEYGRVILPLTVLRRLDCVLGSTKEAVLQQAAQLEGKVENIAPVLERVAGQQFSTRLQLDLSRLLDAPEDLAGNLRHYIASFSADARDVIDRFDFDTEVTRLVRHFSELSNETASEHFTPPEVIRLMVNLMFIEDEQLLTKPGAIKWLAYAIKTIDSQGH